MKNFFAFLIIALVFASCKTKKTVIEQPVAKEVVVDNMAKDIIEKAGTRHRLEDLGISTQEFLESVKRTQSFSIEQKLWFSHAQTIDFSKISDEAILESVNW